MKKDSKRKPPEPPAPAKAPVSRGMGRYLLLFVLFDIAGFEVQLAPMAQGAIRGFSAGIASAAALVIRVFGGHAVAHGNILMSSLNHFQIQIVEGCNGLYVTALLWAAILPYAASWRQKLQGLAFGTAAIHVLNLLRVISLFYLGQYSQPMFDFAHHYVWEALLVVDTLVAFGVWAHLTSGRPGLAHAS